MTTKEVLIAARKLIENKEDWFGGDNPNTGDQRMCALLAISHAHGGLGLAACDAFRDAQGIAGIAFFNDNHTHEEVLAAFDKAIAAQP